MGLLSSQASGLRWLVLDLNSFFASCEQQEQPSLRGKPIAIVPMMAETTCAIAASYPAKARGVKTGTPVWRARELCPDLVCVPARPKLYVEYHHHILSTIKEIIPIEDVMSIDEVSCRLDRVQEEPAQARALGQKMKDDICQKVGACLTSSVGIGQNVMLAKLASNMQKPDGLTLLCAADMPRAIMHLKPQDITGIGENMAVRLARAGLSTMSDLWEADAQYLRRVWGGIGGLRFHALLHGADFGAQIKRKRSIGHQHVLAPNERSIENATPVIRQLMVRAAQRLRKEELFCSRICLEIKWMGNLGCCVMDQTIQETQDTALLLRVLGALWCRAPKWKPLRIGVILSDLTAVERHQMDLFERKKPDQLIKAIDVLNDRFGSGCVRFGDSQSDLVSKIAFQRVPGLDEF